MYFLWIKPRSFIRATSVPNHWTIFPAPGWFFFYLKSVLSKYISLLFLQYIFFCPFTWTMCVLLKWVSYWQQIVWFFFLIHLVCIFLFGEFILFPFKSLLLGHNPVNLLVHCSSRYFAFPFHLLCVCGFGESSWEGFHSITSGLSPFACFHDCYLF